MAPNSLLQTVKVSVVNLSKRKNGLVDGSVSDPRPKTVDPCGDLKTIFELQAASIQFNSITGSSQVQAPVHTVMELDASIPPLYSTQNDQPQHSSPHDDDGILEPILGMEFHSEDAAKTFYDEYARRVGFSTKVGHFFHPKPEGQVVARQFLCAREGLKRRFADSCDASLMIELTDNGKWLVTRFIKEHTHSTLSPSKVHYLRPRRHFAGPTKTAGENYQEVGIVPSGVMYVSMDDKPVSCKPNNAPPIESNRQAKISRSSSYAGRPSSRKKTLGIDAQNLLDYFKKMQGENPGFFYAIQLDQDNRMANVFWADARSRAAYSHFGDAVTLDTVCRVNKYKVPFAPFTGVNQHGQTVLFGCALLLDYSEASFIWLFKTLLAAMNDRTPVSIVTEQHRPILTAIEQVLPETRHCICKWLILREGEDKLAHVCRTHPNFQTELYNCINLTDTIEEFEFCWNSLLEKYDLRKNDWLESLYSARTQWIPAYFRGSFFAAISPNQGFDGSFFDAYVNQQTSLPQFFRMYERALEDLFKKEIEAEFETICTTPVLRTPSPMEKQAANLYTRKIFTKFQEELVETFVYTANRIDGDGLVSTFRVAKFEDDNKAYVVTLNIPEMKASCSCQMFEYSGILCRHILTVFTVTNVLTLPSHYILKRWTRNAKSRDVFDESGCDLPDQESCTLRYNDICREAIKYAEEGAVMVETYNVAVSYMREGGKKISAVKKNVARLAPPPSHASGSSYDDKASTSDMTPLLWPPQNESTPHFNFNDSRVPAQPVSDLNLPRMAPVSLHCGDGLGENMVVLPCLKSMTWVMENKSSTPANKVAVINLKLQDYSKNPSGECVVKFQLSRITLEPMLRSMAYISEQLSTPANKVAVINLKLQDSETTSGESDVKFQVSRDTLGAMLRSMAYIREQLSNVGEPESEQPPRKKQG